MNKYILLIAILVLLFCNYCFSAAGSANNIYLRANPDELIADGKSVATISAEVRDSSGALVPDGTLVSFSTNLGTIQTSVTTVAGVARARLTSGVITGTASISAWTTDGGAVGRVKVDFLAPGTEISRQSFITISSRDYLIYDPIKMIVYALGDVKILHKGLVIKADEAQLNIQFGNLKCKRKSGGESIVLTRGNKRLEALLLYYKINDMKGNIVKEGESGKVERLAFRGADLAVDQDDAEIADSLFDFVDLSDSAFIIKASSITVRPSRDIQLRRAKVYVDGKKMLSIPLHVLSLGGNQAVTSQFVGLGNNGIRLDLPFYYLLSPNSTGSVRLRRGQQPGLGYGSTDNGWAIDLVQDYMTDSGSEGRVTLNRVTSGEWGAYWNHSQEFDSGGRLYSYMDFPAHKDLFGMFSFSQPFSQYNLGLNVYGNRYHDNDGSFSSDLYLQSNPKQVLGGAVNYMLQSRLSYAAGTNYTGKSLGAGLQMQLFGKPIRFSSNDSLSTSLSFGHDWGGTRSGFSTLGNVSYNHRLGLAGNFGLIYSYTCDPTTTSVMGNHRLSANLFYEPDERWRTQLFSTYTLDAPLSSTFANVSYRVAKTWRINLLQTLHINDLSTISDTEIGLGKEINDYEIMLSWSKRDHRFRLDFTAARF